MIYLVHDIIARGAAQSPDRLALRYRDQTFTYADFQNNVHAFSNGLINAGLPHQGRVALYTEKRIETVIALFGTTAAGGIHVPINPLLKPEQVAYILNDCAPEVLVTTAERFVLLAEIFPLCLSIKTVILLDDSGETVLSFHGSIIPWRTLLSSPEQMHPALIDQDIAAILYTSGSTGSPKGVVLSHRNIVAGAASVAQYLALTPDDKILSVLPLSFDYGMNQLTSTFYAGGSVVLMNYLFPRDILTLLDTEKITGLAAVPPLWIQLSSLKWPDRIVDHLRFITNSGGHMPRDILQVLRETLPKTDVFLMYGLTEAFRSTYLPPGDIDQRTDSVGKAIPNADIMIVRRDGTMCGPDEPGELVHRGVHVAMGYWNDRQKTNERFKAIPQQLPQIIPTETAVWSGDLFTKDADGYLYFVGRSDDMIKTSGYRVSPTEIEDILYASKKVAEVAAFGVKHATLGQAIAVIVLPHDSATLTAAKIKKIFQNHAPSYMVPLHIDIVAAPLPRNPNGKIDRQKLAAEHEKALTT